MDEVSLLNSLVKRGEEKRQEQGEEEQERQMMRPLHVISQEREDCSERLRSDEPGTRVDVCATTSRFKHSGNKYTGYSSKSCCGGEQRERERERKQTASGEWAF